MVRRYIVKRNNDVNKKIILNNYLNLYSNMGFFYDQKLIITLPYIVVKIRPSKGSI